MSLNFDMLDMGAFEFQANVGSTSFELITEIRQTNIKIITEVYPIFEHIEVEYKRRFKEKLVE